MKTLIAIPTLTAFYNYPTYFLLFIIGLVFIADLLNRYLESKKIVCEPMPNLNSWSYQDINTMARLHKLKPSNRKKQTLINLLHNL